MTNNNIWCLSIHLTTNDKKWHKDHELMLLKDFRRQYASIIWSIYYLCTFDLLSLRNTSIIVHEKPIVSWFEKDWRLNTKRNVWEIDDWRADAQVRLWLEVNLVPAGPSAMTLHKYHMARTFQLGWDSFRIEYSLRRD